MRLTNKIVVLTGAAKGIGKAIALRMAAEGANLALLDIELRALEQTLHAVQEGSHGRHRAFVVDISDPSSVEKVMSRVFADFGTVDVLINNAGIQTSKVPFQDIPNADWTRTMAINLSGAFYCSQAIAQHFIPRRSGVIINTTSVAGHFLWEGSAAYIVSKAGLEGLTRVMALELAEYDIRVNAVAPGHITTDLNLIWMSIPSERQKAENQVPLRRMGEVEDLTGAYVFLASDDAAYMTGQTIFVDGGMTQTK